MTDPDPLLDELASAHLDGATSAEEAAQVTADPALLARVEELRAVRGAVQALPPVDPARREAAIAAALQAFADERPAAPVTSLASIAERRRRAPAALRLLGVAAAVVLVALLVPLLGRLDESDDAETAERTTFDDAGDDAAAAGGSGPDAAQESAVADATTTTSVALPFDLGSFDEPAELVEGVEQDPRFRSSDATTAMTAAGGDDACAPVPDAGSQATSATATLDGEAVVVIVTDRPDGTRRLQVFAAEACTLLLDRAL